MPNLATGLQIETCQVSRKSNPGCRVRNFDECSRQNSARCNKPGKVPSSMFAGNDGHRVTSEECLVIAYRLYKYLEKAKDVEDREFVEVFAAFNELAAKHEGYEVW